MACRQCPFTSCCLSFFFNDTATTEIYTLSLHDALPISSRSAPAAVRPPAPTRARSGSDDRGPSHGKRSLRRRPGGYGGARAGWGRERQPLESHHGYHSYGLLLL